MFAVESYAAVRRFVFVEGNSQREAAKVFGLSRETIGKMCRFSLPPGYTRSKPVAKPKLGSLLPVIDRILAEDYVAPVKQRHTAKRIFERLRDEHGYGGGYTVVKDYVRQSRVRSRETFVPLAHPPGHAQVDFGEAVGVIGGVRQKVHFFCMDLPQSDACFVKAYPAETTEAFLDGHVCAFAFFGGVPLSILYDNTKIAVAKICGDGKRERTQAFTGLVSHHLFADRFGRPGKGNDKGKVEGLVKYARSHFMVPIRARRPMTTSTQSWNGGAGPGRKSEPGATPRRSGSAWRQICRLCAHCPPARSNHARPRGPASPRPRWCATGPTITRCRPAMASRTLS
jgi:transposase